MPRTKEVAETALLLWIEAPAQGFDTSGRRLLVRELGYGLGQLGIRHRVDGLMQRAVPKATLDGSVVFRLIDKNEFFNSGQECREGHGATSASSNS